MELCRGWAKNPIRLMPLRRYHPEQLMNRIKPLPEEPASPLVRQPVWLRLEGQYVQLKCREELELACRLVCICHNGLDVPSEGETEPPEEGMDESE